MRVIAAMRFCRSVSAGLTVTPSGSRSSMKPAMALPMPVAVVRSSMPCQNFSYMSSMAVRVNFGNAIVLIARSTSCLRLPAATSASQASQAIQPPVDVPTIGLKFVP